MHDALRLLDALGGLALLALWLPIAGWTLLVLAAEGALRLLRPAHDVSLATRGALLAALPAVLLAAPLLADAVPSLWSTAAAPAVASAPATEPAVWVDASFVSAGGPDAPVAAASVAVGLLSVLAGAWSLGALGGLAVTLLRSSAWRRRLPPATEGTVREARRLAARLGLRAPDVRRLPAGSVPFTLGWRRPLVALPDGLSDAERRLALAHELGHIARGDFAQHVAERAVRAAFAWHPAVHVLGAGLALDRERAVDAVVLGIHPGESGAYARLLLRFTSRPSPALALGAGPSRSGLAARLSAMTAPRRPRPALALASALAVLVIPVLMAATAVPDPPPPAAVTAPAPRPSPDARGAAADGTTGQRASRAGYVARSVRLPDGAARLTIPLAPAPDEPPAPPAPPDEPPAPPAPPSAPVPPPPAPGASRGEVFEVVEVLPVLLGGLDGLMSRLVYPAAARAAGVEGRVVVQFVVDETGTPTDVRVVQSPDERLSAAAVSAVGASRFQPGRQRGRAVKARFVLPVQFQLPAGATDGGDRGAARPGRGAVRYAGLDLERLTPASRGAVERTLAALPAQLAGQPYGAVRVTYLIAPDGTTSRFRVESGPRDLHHAAVAVARRVVVREGARPGAPVEGSFTLWHRAS